MKKMKGITPIISIIILLLITVGLAAAAWSYMGNYMTTLTAKVIEIPTQICVNGTDAMALIHNMGTASINVGANSDITVLKSDGSAVTPTWTEVGSYTTVTRIEAGGYARATIANCAGSTPKRCSYDFIIAGRSQKVTVDCPGG